MPSVTSPTLANRLIDGLPRAEQARILEHCETVELVLGAVLCQPDKPIRHVYFPLSGSISQVASVSGHAPLELGLTGTEGMLGLTLVLGVPAAPLQAKVVAGGLALRMTAASLRRCLDHSPSLQRALSRHLYLLLGHLAQTAACTGFHDVEARLARWLLLSHDRAPADHFHLTHEILADMLGVQRSAVTIAAGQLQKAGLISYTRGEISILDRPGLEAMSCECYLATAAHAAWLAAPRRAAQSV